MKTSVIINKIQIQKETDKTLYVLNFEKSTQICCKEEIGLYSYQDNVSHIYMYRVRTITKQSFEKFS